MNAEQSTAEPLNFTAIDWILVTIAAFSLFSLLAFSVIGVAFQAKYVDLNIDVPMITKFVTQPWGPALMAITPGFLFGYGLFANEKRLRLSMFVSLAASLSFIALCLSALYLPL